jgi:hypothetical protein
LNTFHRAGVSGLIAVFRGGCSAAQDRVDLAMVAKIRTRDRPVQGPRNVQLSDQRHRRQTDRQPSPQTRC